MGHGKVLNSSTTAKRRLRWTIGLKAGLTEEAGCQWGVAGTAAFWSRAVLWLEAEARGW
jgi:hypothetical protein